jgi:hypothetical protein
MYFWRIEKLKAEMAARPLSEREVLPYLVLNVVLCSVAVNLPKVFQNHWDGLGAVWSVLLAVVGTIYVYRRNGGADGQHFLQRYMAIGWVVIIRWFAILILGGIAFYGALMAVRADVESTHWYDFLFFAAFEAVVYWRMGYHVRDLAQRPAAA